MIAMVGLPARGKTYVARKLERYLGWCGFPTRVFNVGDYRREKVGAKKEAAFFDPDDPGTRALRRALAMDVLDTALAWLDEGGRIAIYDATNTTGSRRRAILDRCDARGVPVLFLEVVRRDEAVIDANIRETKLTLPDYEGIAPDAAFRDFRARIAHYASAYDPMAEEEGSFLQWIDGGRRIVLHRVEDVIGSRIAQFLAHLGSGREPVWLTRHGESQHNRHGLLGGDASLSDAGRAYAERLAREVHAHEASLGSFVVWTSSLRRTVETAAAFPGARAWRALDEIHAGVCEELTYEQIRERHPEVAEQRARDKFRYRYPRGESYEDLIARLDPVVLALERRTSPTLIVGHQAVLRALYAYLIGIAPERCPHVDIPLHTLIRFTPSVQGLSETRTAL
jgi:broad specificity phosphatase PhoE/predicted kinase